MPLADCGFLCSVAPGCACSCGTNCGCPAGNCNCKCMFHFFTLGVLVPLGVFLISCIQRLVRRASFAAAKLAIVVPAELCTYIGLGYE